MNRLPQQPRLTEFPISSWLRTIRSGVQRNQTIQGGDVNVSETAYGIRFRNKKNDGFFMRWTDAYLPNSAYKEGDVSYVPTDVTYVGKDDDGVTAKDYYSRAGIYICVYPVPANLTPTGFAGSPQYVVDYIAASNQRVANVVYAPVYPMPTSFPDSLTNGAIQGKYWHLIGFAPMETGLCQDGVEQTFYIQSAQSGSLA